MAKNGSTQVVTSVKQVKKILITQPRPEGEKSPYFELARKYGIAVDFHPFIIVESVPSKDFRKQKIDIANYSAVIFTSCGPTTAERRPPAMTQLIALGRKESEAVSTAAKR